MTKKVHVAVAVMRNQAGKVFVTRRADDVHQGGLWEFPGGKVEEGESPREALNREIMEENGVEIHDAKSLIQVPFDYPDKKVLLDVWEVTKYSGEPHGREGQKCDWVNIEELSNRPFPEANQSIIASLRLPDKFLVTPEPGESIEQFLSSLKNSIERGVEWLQFRATTLQTNDYDSLAAHVCELCSQSGVRVMLRSKPGVIQSLGAAGLHLTATQLMSVKDRPVSPDSWLSASCHTKQEILHANDIGVDFIFIGSVMKTGSHADVVPIGWDEFSRLASIAIMPAYAIGGMSLDDIAKARQQGGQGIAAISSLWASN